jgi:signal transduction histidine kinase
LAPIWIVSVDPGLALAAELPLRGLREVFTGPPERSAWRGVKEPDLIVLVAPEAPEGDMAGVERLLEFLAGIRPARRTPIPVLYVEPPGGRPPAEWVAGLIDDRPSASFRWPPDPDELRRRAGELIDAPVRPPSLRERARISWVRQRVERLYAGLDLPPLRQAIDPRNAGRPVLLVGERGTGRALLARYIHQLSEPSRQSFVRLALGGLRSGELEEVILGRTAGAYATLYVHGFEAAATTMQEDLAELLTEGGIAALETVRWIVAAERPLELCPSLRLAPWLRVDLPPLRARSDLPALVEAWMAELAARTGREISVSPETLEALEGYAWPGNLRELEAVLDASVASTTGEVLQPDDLRFELGLPIPRLEAPGAPLVGEEPAPAVQPAPASTESVESKTEPEASVPPSVEGREELEPEPLADPPQKTAETVRELPAGSIVVPLAEEIRAPLLALRTYAGLFNQRPDDPGVRQRLSSLLEGDLRRIEDVIEQTRQYSSFGAPEPKAVNLAALLTRVLQSRLATIRERRLVMLEELDHEAPPVDVDEEQLRFAFDALFGRALRMVPSGGDLYVGSRYLAANDEQPARHRILIRFHSPEDVLVPPDEAAAGGIPLELLIARSLVERMGGTLGVDVSGPHDNLVLIEVPS